MRVAIVGTGAMGTLVKKICEENDSIDEVCAVEPASGESLQAIARPDVIIDFSHPDALKDISRYIMNVNGIVPVVFATTGFSEKEEEVIESLGKKVPVLKSANFSMGINILSGLVRQTAIMTDDKADIEIIEKHHNKKNDAPSGTALMLAEEAMCGKKRELKYGRRGREKRGDEIGMHCVRGGTIFGEHTVIFAMDNEVIELKHIAYSREIFAKGAVKAALCLIHMEPGMYSFSDIL